MQVRVVALQRVILLLLGNQTFLVLLQLSFKEVDQVITALCVISQVLAFSLLPASTSISGSPISGSGTKARQVALSILTFHGILQVAFQSLDHLLTEVRSLGEFLLDFFMDFDFTLQSLNL